MECGDDLDEVLQGSAQAIQTPDDQGVPFPHVANCIVQALPLCGSSTHRVGVDFYAAGACELILLQVEVLVLGRDPGKLRALAMTAASAGLRLTYDRSRSTVEPGNRGYLGDVR